MATTQNTYTGDNSTTLFSFTFPYLEESDVKVSLDGVDKTQTTDYTFANATQISFNTAPGTGVAIRIYRETNIDAAQATFFAGSSIRSQDLNDNNNQLLYSTQETVNRRLDKTGGTLTGDLVMDNADIVFEGATDDAFETTLTVVDPTADRTITLPNVTGTVVTTGDTGTVATAMIAADAVDGTKIADDSINSEHYVDASIDTQHIADAQITTAKIAADAVTNAKIADDSIDSEHYVDGSIDTAHIADLQVTTAKIAADAVTNAKIADDSIDSEHYVDGSIDTAHIADLQITTAKIAADAIDGTKIADDAIDSEHYTDGSIDRPHLAADIVDGTKIADDSIDSEHYVDQSIDAAHLSTNSVTTAKINADAITNAKIADNAVQQENINGLTATIAELNQLDGNTLSNSGVDWTSGTTYPSASQISARLEAFGGFEAIANEASFPNTTPAEGVIISIADAGGLTVNASGTSTNGATLDTTAVTINNFPSGFHSTTLDDGIGLLVVATSTANTYNFHRVVAKDEDVRQLSSDINDFKARYRIGSTNPTTDNDEGDLFYNTGSNTMLVWDGSAWTEVQSIGEYFIIPDSDFPTWNGTINDISITSNAPANAEQIILSINGVIQEPNSGTARPTDGFSLNGSTIQLSDPPATGSEAWGVIIGSTVNIGEPSANTVSTAKIVDGAVTTAKIADDAVTAAKLADTAVTAGSYTAADITVDAQGRITAASSGTISTAEIADDAVTAAKLADTAVTPGSYTLSSITVDAQGRITAASSGTAADPDIITEGNTSVEVVDTGSDGHFKVTTEGTERMRIDSSGNVGIGTENPSQLLEINGASTPSVQIKDTTNNVIARIGADDNVAKVGSRSNHPVQFQVNDGEVARLDTSGRLLVGTSSASGNNKLQVSGDALIHGLTLGQGNVTNNNNTAFGFEALANNTNVNNTAIGFRALKSNTSGGRNTAMGLNALRDHTTGTNNTAIGCDALYQQTTASFNTAVGDQAGKRVSSGQQNVLVGMFAGQDINTGNNNTCVGYGAGYGMTSGYNNVCIGNLAGNYTTTITTGTNNIMIGERPTPSASNGTHQINIATSAGTQGKGNNTGFISPNGGGVYQGNNSSSWSTTSDRRLKKNIVDNTEGLDVINQVRVVNFEYRLPEEIEQEDLQGQALVKRDENEEITGLQGVKLGVIAQELQQVCPDCVREESSGILGVVDDNLFWHLINAVKELSAKNASLEARLTALEGGN